MLLAPLVHRRFDKLDLWLTSFEVSECVLNLCTMGLPPSLDYTITETSSPTSTLKINYARGIWHFRTSTTFQANALPNGKKIEPPSPKLIALHDVCAKIAHLSGAAGHLKETVMDTKPLSVMTAPNAANELAHALKKVQLQHLTKPVHG